MDNNEKLLKLLNEILVSNEKSPLVAIQPTMNLKNDIGFDSIEMVELVVAMEDQFEVDIFESGNVETIGDLLNII